MMDLREMVERINAAPTILVKVNMGDGETHGSVVAKPARYDEESGNATIYRYYGPRDWKNWADVRDTYREEEKVVRSGLLRAVPGTRIGGAVVNGVTPFPTDLDVIPLRQLPLWAKRLFVKCREMLQPDGIHESMMNADMIDGMKRMIRQEENITRAP